MSAAVARDDAGVRQFFLDQTHGSEPVLRGTAPPNPVEPHVALTIRGPDSQQARHVAGHGTQRKTLLAARTPGPEPRRATATSRRSVAKPPPILFASDPKQPAVVSIYEDRTLRRGDAVMTLAGLRVFAGSRTFPYRPEDFATLTATRTINGQLRRALIELDQNPPLRG